jgi:chromate transporter
VSFGEALKFWLKLGFISFGGPRADRDHAPRAGGAEALDFRTPLPACAQLLHGAAGPEAQQLATYIGWLMHRTWGGIVAGGLFVLPSLLILIALSWIYVAFGNVGWVAGLFYGIKPAVAAIVLQAVWRIGSRTLKHPRKVPLLWTTAVASFFAIAFLKIPFPLVVAVAALTGVVGARLVPAQFAPARGMVRRTRPGAPALIDDHTPTPPHALFRKSRLAVVVGVVPCSGWSPCRADAAARLDSTLAQMGWFFTKAAMLTFGGAYAVLPYVYQGAVDHYQWLTGPQMIDGLALGENHARAA